MRYVAVGLFCVVALWCIYAYVAPYVRRKSQLTAERDFSREQDGAKKDET